MNNRIFALALVAWLTTPGLAADPFVSAGFLKMPPELQLGAVSAVAVDATDAVYVLHRGEPPILAFDAQENYLRGWGQGMFKTPHGLRVDRDGAIWTTDNGNHVLRKFTSDGRLLLTLGTEGKAAGGAMVFRSPDDLVFDSQGNILVADSGNARIVKLDQEGAFLQQWGSKGKASGQFATAHALAIDSQDHLYVADRGNQRIQIFDSAGRGLGEWRGFGNPFGLLVVGDELLVSEGDVHTLFVLDREGQIVARWGDPVTLQLPHLMAVNSQGVVYVAEVNGKRVQKLRRP